MHLFYKLIFLFPIMLFSQSNFEKAEQLFLQKKYDLAKPIFQKILKENPNQLKVLEYLGDIEGSQKSWDNAIKYYGKLKSLKPQEADYQYKYGGCLGMKAKESNKFRALGMIGDVKNAFETAIALNPQHIGARWALIELYLELPGIVGGSERKAQQYASELLKISPVDGYLAKGYIEEYFKRYSLAEMHYSKANDIGNSKITSQKLANLYVKMNQPQKAKTILNSYSKNKG